MARRSTWTRLPRRGHLHRPARGTDASDQVRHRSRRIDRPARRSPPESTANRSPNADVSPRVNPQAAAAGNDDVGRIAHQGGGASSCEDTASARRQEARVFLWWAVAWAMRPVDIPEHRHPPPETPGLRQRSADGRPTRDLECRRAGPPPSRFPARGGGGSPRRCVPRRAAGSGELSRRPACRCVAVGTSRHG